MNFTFLNSDIGSSTELINNLINEINISSEINTENYVSLLENTHFLLNNSDNDKDYNLALKAICNVAERKPKERIVQQLLFDCIVASRVYPYESMLEKQITDLIYQKSIYDYVGEEHYRFGESILTKDQKKLFESYMEHKKIIVSAPTSFGKSKIIEEILRYSEYKNVVIVLPTIALINETYLRFKKNPFFSNYLIYNSVTKIGTFESDRKNLCILTPEKTDLLLDRFPNILIDFFAFDEIYKIQDDDGRKMVFNNVLYRLVKKAPHFYLIGPYFKNFSENFIKKTNSKFFHFEAEVVQKATYDISSVESGDLYKVNGNEVKKHSGKRVNLKHLLNNIEEQSLVYVKRKDSVESIAKYISQLNETDDENNELIEYIIENISSEWSLASCLKSRVAFHHGNLPKYIQTEIVDSFNNGELDTIVCTTTLIEGVNTTAKNVIIYDNMKGTEPLTGFDIKNMKGRAGRFLQHFLGNIYALENLTEEKEKNIIECEYYDNDNLSAENALQIDDEDLSENNLSTKQEAIQILNFRGIDIEVIKSNKYIPIHKQVGLITFLESDLFVTKDLEFSSNLPSGEQLDLILELCFDYLFNEKEKEDRTFFLANLKRLTKFYVYSTPSIKQLIETQYAQKTDTKVRNTFKLISHYFEFYLPKVLTAFQTLFNYVSEKNEREVQINLNYLITKLEFGFTNDHEVMLKEAGVPNDLIRKVSNSFSDCSSLLQIRIKYQLNKNLLGYLSPFERRMFERYV